MPQPRKSSTSRPIERETAMAWWCPFDDHSNMTLTTTCGGCGAVREGDTVRAPKQFTPDNGEAE